MSIFFSTFASHDHILIQHGYSATMHIFSLIRVVVLFVPGFVAFFLVFFFPCVLRVVLLAQGHGHCEVPGCPLWTRCKRDLWRLDSSLRAPLAGSSGFSSRPVKTVGVKRSKWTYRYNCLPSRCFHEILAWSNALIHHYQCAAAVDHQLLKWLPAWSSWRSWGPGDGRD